MHPKTIEADCHLATAEGLMRLLVFIHETAEPDDWRHLHDPLGFLITEIASATVRGKRAFDASLPPPLVPVNDNGSRP